MDWRQSSDAGPRPVDMHRPQGREMQIFVKTLTGTKFSTADKERVLEIEQQAYPLRYNVILSIENITGDRCPAART